MKRFFYILVFLFICTVGHATHNRAGQLLYRHISGYTYEFTQVHFFFTPSPATGQRIQTGLDISWGDNTTSRIRCIDNSDPRCVEIEILPDNYTKVVFREIHHFPGPGTYIIVVEDKNRNANVLNIPLSDAVAYSNTTIFRIDPNVRPNNTPELLTYPIDKAAIGQRFVHNPSAFDIDGDSLSYELVVCTRDRGVPIEGYRFPNEIESAAYPDLPRELWVDPVKGDLVWNVPVKAGLYNVAMRINEWRHDGEKMVKIGNVVRDMQIEVVDSKNKPPVLPNFKDTCVIAGTPVSLSFRTTDPDNDRIKVTATGGPFEVLTNKATIDTTGGPGYTDVTFTWQTDNSHVRKQPYTVVFKAEDQNKEVKLVSFTNYNITVIAPEVENLTATAEKKDILLEWNQSVCDHASGYEIYRRVGSNDPLDLNSCETGIPQRYGYELVTFREGIDNTMYHDNNNGKGLSPGLQYCYRVVAVFSDGAKSKPGNEACASLLAGMPPMIRAHVETVDILGKIHVAWLERPMKDKIVDKPGPFEYRLFYTMDVDNWPVTPRITKSLNDTTYIHEQVDTKTKYPHYYKVELWDTGAGSIVDEDFEIASTLYPILKPSDKSVIINFGRYTPWVNDEYEIYRCDKTGTDICIPDVSNWVGRTNRETYTDSNLRNGQSYCYRIESKGYRFIEGVSYRNVNWSHVACVTPIDNVPPCAPELEAKSLCDENRNQLDWTYDHSCMYDVEKYRIYFSPDPAQPFTKIDSVMSRDIHTYSHKETLKGCYYVTAVDTAGNQSRGSNIVCLDECGEYKLPNVFTPNGDGFNDVFKSFNPGRVTKVDMKIYNRGGKLVYKTNDPDINWDGRDIDSKRFVSSGVYYYICEVYEERLTGSKAISLTGFVHVFYGKDAQPYVPPID